MFKRLIGAVVGLAVAGMVTAAQALTVQILASGQDALDLMDPADSLDLGVGYWETARTSVTGTTGSFWSSPWEGDPDFATTAYWTVGAAEVSCTGCPDDAPNSPNPAVLLFDTKQDVLTLLWGSVDNTNQILFYDSDGNLINTVVGKQHGTGAGSGVPGVALVSILTDQSFSRVEFFQASGNAFEFSNVSSTVVPLPAAFPLFLTAISGLGFLGWRRRRASTNADAA